MSRSFSKNSRCRSGLRRPLRAETLETRRLLAGDLGETYEPSRDPDVGAVVTAFIENAPTDPQDGFHIGSSWIDAVHELAQVGASEVTFGVYRVVGEDGSLRGGPTLQEVAGAVQVANEVGLSVTILPLFELDHLHWRGVYDPVGAERDLFRLQYSSWIADLANIPGIDRFNVGSELNAMVNNPDNFQFFDSLIQTVKANSSARIGYVGNFDAYANPQHESIWQHPDIDYIAISLYYSITDPADASTVAGTGPLSESQQQTLEDSWNQKLDWVEQVASDNDLPVVIQEFGATQRNYSSVYPWAVWPGDILGGAQDSQAEDPYEQKAVFQALLSALDGRSDVFESVNFYTWEHGASRGERYYESVDPSEPRYIESFAIWPTDGGGGQYVAEFLSTADSSAVGNATLVVTTADDELDSLLPNASLVDFGGADDISLREAIVLANQTSDADIIGFELDGGMYHTITLDSALPALTTSVTIDGTSQDGFEDEPLIGIDGIFAGTAADGIVVRSDSVTISGLAIYNFGGEGIEVVSGNDVLLQDNYVGLDLNGDAAGNWTGVLIRSELVTVNNNVISGNDRSGIFVNSVQTGGNLITNNYIGVNPAGDQARPNGTDGITLYASNNQIGLAGQGNLISGNTRAGVYSRTPGRGGNRIQGNALGVNLTQSSTIPNRYGVDIRNENNLVGGSLPGQGNVIGGSHGAGVVLSQATAVGNQVYGNEIGTNSSASSGLGNLDGVQITQGSGNVIGGTGPGEGNLISGNRRRGISVLFSQSTNNTIAGNRIGTNHEGTASVANEKGGIRLGLGASGNTIASNQIAGNQLMGVTIDGATTSGNAIVSNLIGTSADGTQPLHNGSRGAIRVLSPQTYISGNVLSDGMHGVVAFRDAVDLVIRGNQIGGPSLGTPNGISLSAGAIDAWVTENEISHNGTAVSVQGEQNARIENNSIHDNGLGIDHGGDGVNSRWNAPTILSAQITGSQIAINYQVDSQSAPSNSLVTVEFFLDDGNGQGQTRIASDQYWVGQTAVVKQLTLPANGLAAGQRIVATSTDRDGNTSEFSISSQLS